MHSIQFWKSWPTVYQRLLGVLLPVFIFSLAIAILSFVRSPAPVFTWQQLQELRQQELPLHDFDVGGFNLTVFGDNNILFERWMGNPMEITMNGLDIYLALFSIALVILMALVTVLPRFWFLAGSGALIFMISSFQFETLQIFGVESKIPAIAVMVVLLGAGLYYQFINKGASFLQRVLVFMVISAAIGGLVAKFSDTAQPLRYLATNTLPASIVLLIIFIIAVAHEIMASFVSLVGQGTRNSKSLQHYLIISTIYLINLWLSYWNKIGWNDWGFIVHPVVLLFVSGILAIWGIRQRRSQYEQIIAADPFGVYFIVALGTIAFATVGYFFASANDVALLSLNDLILYSYIGYGMMFIVYMASNFMGMLANNFPVYKVLYKPTAMPYFSYRMGGFIFMLALLLYNSWMVPVNHFISAYNTSLGDLFGTGQKSILAEGYYKRAFFYASYNQHASTALASFEAARNKTLKEQRYLAAANEFKPTEFTLMNSADIFHQYGNTLEEILFLQGAKQQLPKSGVINNNLGLLYARVGVIDSAYRSFLEARKTNLTEASADMNLLGLIAQSKININVDSVYQLLHSQQLRVKSNVLAIANRQGKQIDMTVELPKDSILDLFSASLIGNYITNQLTKTDTSFLANCIRIAHNKKNHNFSEAILVPAANACYISGQVNRAFQLLQEVIFGGSDPGKHNTTLALWSLDLGKPDGAIAYLQYALSQNSAAAKLVNAVTLAEAGRIDEAVTAWDTLRYHKDSVTRSMAESMKRVLVSPFSQWKNFTDKEKYQYIHYRVPLADSIQFEQLVSQVADEDLRAKTILDRSKKWFAQDEIPRASRTYQKLQGLHLTDSRLFTEIKYYELRLFAAQGEWPLVQAQIQKGILFGPYRETERVYYEALKLAASGDTVNAARNFYWLARNNSYFDEGVVAAAKFFQKHSADSRTVYSILSEALQVNRNSVKILKTYIPAARARGYNDFAASALQTLQPLITPSAFRKFVIENQLSHLVFQ